MEYYGAFSVMIIHQVHCMMHEQYFCKVLGFSWKATSLLASSKSDSVLG